MNTTHCSVLQRANPLGHDLSRTLYRLKRTIDICRSCPLHADCEVVQQVEESVAQAAQKVLDELWS